MTKSVPSRVMPVGMGQINNLNPECFLAIFRRYILSLDEQLKMTNEGDKNASASVDPIRHNSSPRESPSLPIFYEAHARTGDQDKTFPGASTYEHMDAGNSPHTVVMGLPPIAHLNTGVLPMNNDAARNCGNELLRKDGHGLVHRIDPTPRLNSSRNGSALAAVGNISQITFDSVIRPIVTSPVSDATLATLCLGRELKLHLGREW